MLTIYCRNRLETQIERKREKNEDFLRFIHPQVKMTGNFEKLRRTQIGS